MYTDLTILCVGVDTSIHQAIVQMETSRIGIVLVVDSERRLLGTITDGDVRRLALANVDFNQSVKTVLERKAGTSYAHPITASASAENSTLLGVLRQHDILHLPLLDQDQRVVGLVTLDDFVPEQTPPFKAVIMAGGRGSRLRPLTEELPKPMLPVGDRPLMEITIQGLSAAGIKNVTVAVHHQSESITNHFGDGRKFGVEISYLNEERPLGTAGALGLMEVPQETTLVINGDILTQVDFRAMLAYHRDQGADLTMAVQNYKHEVPYGVVECEGATVTGLTEKPQLSFLANAGIYLLEPSVYRFIPHGKRYDMTDLIQHLVSEGCSVVAFPVREYWMDIGEHADYERAQQHARTGQR